MKGLWLVVGSALLTFSCSTQPGQTVEVPGVDVAEDGLSKPLVDAVVELVSPVDSVEPFEQLSRCVSRRQTRFHGCPDATDLFEEQSLHQHLHLLLWAGGSRRPTSCEIPLPSGARAEIGVCLPGRA